MRTALIALMTLALFGCTAAAPLKTADDEPFETADRDGSFVVAVTHARVRSGRKGDFDDHVQDVLEQARGSDGFVAHAFRAELPGDDRWTMTIWEDEAAMKDFAYSGAHLLAMAEASTLLEAVRSASFEVDAEELPVDWERALDALDPPEDVAAR